MSDLLAVRPSEMAVADASDTIRRIIGSDLSVESVEVPSEPQQGALILRGRLNVPSHVAFRRWLSELRPVGYTPMLRHDETDTNDDAVRLNLFAMVPPQVQLRPWLNIYLFILTVISTLFVGAIYGGTLDGVSEWYEVLLPQHLIEGWPFSVTLLTILVAHEFGHYFAARFHNVAVTLPYFIPLPVGFGTLGAVIRLMEPISDRRKLFDIGIAGPLAGLIFAIPLLFLGLSTSPVAVPPPNIVGELEGNSILYYFAKLAVFGKPLPNPLTGEDVFMNQVTFAAWIGLLVTALNLLPVGQLDGGHTVYALFGRNARYINWATIALMAVFAVAGLPPLQTLWPVLRNIGFVGWWLWLGLILFVIGPYHPPALDDVTRLDGRRRLIGYLVILCFIITFVPTPFREL